MGTRVTWICMGWVRSGGAVGGKGSPRPEGRRGELRAILRSGDMPWFLWSF